MRHSLIVAAKVLFVCVVFCYPVSSGAATATSPNTCKVYGSSIAPVAVVQDSLGKPGGSKIFWWNRQQSKSDFGKAFALSAAVSVGLAIVLILFVPAAKGAFLLPILAIALLATGIIYSIIGLFVSRKKRDRIISAIALLSGVITAVALYFNF
jgi:hypothetical protein